MARLIAGSAVTRNLLGAGRSVTAMTDTRREAVQGYPATVKVPHQQEILSSAAGRGLGGQQRRETHSRLGLIRLVRTD